MSEENKLIKEARELLASSIKNKTRKDYLLSLFDLRYMSGSKDGLSFKEISEINGIHEPVLRIDKKSMWRFINEQNNFVERNIERIRKVTKGEWPFVIDLDEVKKSLCLGNGASLFIKDILKSDFLVPHHMNAKFRMYVVKRSDKYFLSSDPKVSSLIRGSKSKKNVIRCYITNIIESGYSEQDKDIAAVLQKAAKELGRQGDILLYRVGIYGNAQHSESLQDIGHVFGGITRERVRQLCTGAVNDLLRIENNLGYGPLTSIAQLVENNSKELSGESFKVSSFSQLIEKNKELEGFKGKEQGLYFIAKMIGVSGISRANGFWIVDKGMSKDEVSESIRKFTAKKRADKQTKKESANVITFVSKKVVEKVKKASLTSGLPMNEHYAKAVQEFVEISMRKDEQIIVNHVEWDNRDQLKMVNMRLDKNIVEDVRKLSLKLSSNGISKPSRADLLLTAVNAKFG